MYEKKLRQLFEQSKENAEQALDEGDHEAAASYYEQCGDILEEQAKNSRGKTKEKKQELAEQYYELRDNLLGKSDSLRKDKVPARHNNGTADDDEDDFSSTVERFVQQTDVTWDDVAGLSETKENLKESFALAAIQNKPKAIESLHSILLYGPPGTGKTLLASAVAGSHDYPFYNVKLSQALSKYYGESEKIISAVFDSARERSPAIIFMDEIDSVAMARGGDMDEPTRRVLSTLLTELSGLNKNDDEIMLIAATNAPWDLDPAVLSRMERVIYVPLPDETTAKKIIRLNTVDEGVDLSMPLDEIAAECVDRYYSGREVKNLCKEAIRHMVDEQNPELEALSEKPVEEMRDYQLKTRDLTMDDFEHAFSKITPKTDKQLLKRYEEWEADF